VNSIHFTYLFLPFSASASALPSLLDSAYGFCLPSLLDSCLWLSCLSPSVSLSVSPSQLTVSRFSSAEFPSPSPLSVVGCHPIGKYPEQSSRVASRVGSVAHLLYNSVCLVVLCCFCSVALLCFIAWTVWLYSVLLTLLQAYLQASSMNE